MRFLLRLLFVVPAFASAAVHAALNVFACEPEWATLATELGGDKVSVYSATSALQDVHRIEARPSLIARVRTADLVVCTGADLEVAWLPLVLRSAGNAKVRPGQPGHLMAADYVPMIDVPARLDRAQGDVHPYGNPHVHTDPRNILRVAQALGERLAQLDAANAAAYRSRTADFLARWSKAIAQWEAHAAPLKGMRFVPYHKEYGYLARWLGLVEAATIEPKPGIPPTAGYLGKLVTTLQADPAAAIVRSAYTDPKAADWLSQRTAIPVVVLPYTVGGTPAAKDLFGLFDDTIQRLLKVHKPA